MEAVFRLLPGPQPFAIRYGVSALIVFLAFAFRLSVGEGTGRFGFIHFILPVVASSLLFDRKAGFFAVALSAGLVASVVPWTSPAGNVSAIAVFVTVAGCLVFVAEGLHTALVKAHAAQTATDMLLQEMSHRVKNKFSMISSIIALQARSSTPEVRAALEDISSRVNVIATVHNYLQLSRHDGLIDMSEYLPALCKALQQALCGPRPISMKATAVPAQLRAEKALAVGVIVNELVTNVFKYAFEQDRPLSLSTFPNTFPAQSSSIAAVANCTSCCPATGRSSIPFPSAARALHGPVRQRSAASRPGRIGIRPQKCASATRNCPRRCWEVCVTRLVRWRFILATRFTVSTAPTTKRPSDAHRRPAASA